MDHTVILIIHTGTWFLTLYNVGMLSDVFFKPLFDPGFNRFMTKYICVTWKHLPSIDRTENKNYIHELTKGCRNPLN